MGRERVVEPLKCILGGRVAKARCLPSASPTAQLFQHELLLGFFALDNIRH